MSNLPKRSLDTMSEAIALSSPSGRMSKRARKDASRRLSEALFGLGGLKPPSCPQPTESERLTRHISEYRDLAERGFRPRAMRREIARLESQLNAARTAGKEEMTS